MNGTTTYKSEKSRVPDAANQAWNGVGVALSPQLSERPVLTVDVEAYQAFLDTSDLSDEQKEEFLLALWSIVVSFVDIGFGIHPLQAFGGQVRQGDPEGSTNIFDPPQSENSAIADFGPSNGRDVK